MKVKDMIELGRQGDEYAFKCLEEHYKPILKEYISKNYGEKASEDFMKLIPNLIVYYYEKNIKDVLYKFLKDKADTLYREKNPIIGKSLDKEDNEKINLIIEHYANFFYNKILKYNSVLTEQELKNFSHEFIKEGILKLKSNNCDVRNYMVNLITREVKRYDKDQEFLLKRYMLIVGINQKILDYYMKKYEYLLKRYENDRMYSCLCSNYENLISESLRSFNKINLNIERIIIKNLIKKFNLQREQENEILKDRNNTNENFKLLYENYSYIKNTIFYKFNPLLDCDSEVLKEEIDKKYREFIMAYLKGESNNYVQRYLNTRLSDYFNSLNANQKLKSSINTDPFCKEELFFLNKDLINMCMKKLKAFITKEDLRKGIKNCYMDSYDEYVKKERKTTFRRYTYFRLIEYVNKINNMYGINYIDDMVSNIKKGVKTSNTISTNILDEVFDGWRSYYINSDIHNKINFEEFMITCLLKFNESDYKEIIDIKRHINCKVLRR